MTWTMRLRQIHRWLSIAFSAAVVANIVALIGHVGATWIGLLAFVPLIPLMATGLWLFVQPYAKGLRSRRRGPVAAE